MAKTNHKFPDHANRNYYERDTEFEVLLNSLYHRDWKLRWVWSILWFGPCWQQSAIESATTLDSECQLCAVEEKS